MDKNDYISLTDIARRKELQHTDDMVRNWRRNRNTIGLLGLWETMYNSGFKSVEFDGFKKQAGLNSSSTITQMSSLLKNNVIKN